MTELRAPSDADTYVRRAGSTPADRPMGFVPGGEEFMMHAQELSMSLSKPLPVDMTRVGKAAPRVVTVSRATPTRRLPIEDAPTFAPYDMDEDTWDEAIRMRYGWCPSCEEFTRRDIDPRASARACSECFDGRVCGAIHARRAGFVWVQS